MIKVRLRTSPVGLIKVGFEGADVAGFTENAIVDEDTLSVPAFAVTYQLWFHVATVSVT